MTLTTIRPKPMELQAVQVTKGNMEDVAKWCHGGVWGSPGKENVIVKTGEYYEYARIGDWVVRISEGDYLVLSGDQFAERYERVEAP